MLIVCTFAAPVLFLLFALLQMLSTATESVSRTAATAVRSRHGLISEHLCHPSQPMSLCVCLVTTSNSRSRPRMRLTVVGRSRYGWVGTEVLWLSALASAREMDLVAQWVFGQHFQQPCDHLQTTLGLQCVKINGQVEARCWV